eukprot:CAMPEP_0202923784 /NCGR_PEP_ID=MMETSP1392-20130828/78633_1 /ASSEMBLY_ACC=CAM_ASM_000868 /TAXON_ID=225041 /ORGANISM="Chlamydomonas chlamydogama, Strain SAG 11-48b" /LENGTH=86 /DNA_ID=CAMNT_0049617483 /DNA_START=418 /DNA_END=675 /DNA_ORIENTATION=+
MPLPLPQLQPHQKVQVQEVGVWGLSLLPYRSQQQQPALLPCCVPALLAQVCLPLQQLHLGPAAAHLLWVAEHLAPQVAALSQLLSE